MATTVTYPADAKISIFISYAREDKGIAAKLAHELEKKGYQVWWDHHLLPGQDYREQITSRLDNAKKVIVLWSSHSVRSAFVIDEARRANERQKLIPIVIDVADPPMGFGHLQSVQAKDIEQEFGRIHAAIEDRPHDVPPQVQRTIRHQRYIMSGLAGLLALGAVSLLGYYGYQKHSVLAGLDPKLDYREYNSDTMKLSFVYPQAVLQLDTTKQHEGVIPLITSDRKVEAKITRTKLPTHNNVRIGRDVEKEAIEKSGATLNYVGPQKEKYWSNWYILSGQKPDGSEFFYRRWYTDRDVVSMEFDYPKEKIELYNRVIEDMTNTQQPRFKFY